MLIRAGYAYLPHQHEDGRFSREKSRKKKPLGIIYRLPNFANQVCLRGTTSCCVLLDSNVKRRFRQSLCPQASDNHAKVKTNCLWLLVHCCPPGISVSANQRLKKKKKLSICSSSESGGCRQLLQWCSYIRPRVDGIKSN